MQTKYILATGTAIFGIGGTPESAYENGKQFGEFPPMHALPRHIQRDGSAYIGRASLALCQRAADGNPACSRVEIGDIEYTPEEAQEME